MDEVGVDVHGIEIGAPSHRGESRTQRLWARKITRFHFEADDLEITLLDTLIAKATHFHRHRLCQLARQVPNVHACTAIDVGGVLVSQEKNLHGE